MVLPLFCHPMFDIFNQWLSKKCLDLCMRACKKWANINFWHVKKMNCGTWALWFSYHFLKILAFWASFTYKHFSYKKNVYATYKAVRRTTIIVMLISFSNLIFRQFALGWLNYNCNDYCTVNCIYIVMSVKEGLWVSPCFSSHARDVVSCAYDSSGYFCSYKVEVTFGDA